MERLRSTTLTMASAVFLTILGCGENDAPQEPVATGDEAHAASPSLDMEKLRPRVEKFCAGCHPYPKPDTFPRAAWPAEVRQAYQFFVESNRKDLRPPPLEDVIAFYQSQAPETLTLQSPPQADSHQFKHIPIPLPKNHATPNVAFMKWIPEQRKLVVSDMRTGEILSIQMKGDRPIQKLLATVRHAAHIEPVDFDGDGRLDLLVADLGSFEPSDNDKGRVILLRATPQGYEEQILLDGIGRVADVRPLDFDDDGDFDLVVAEFGWHRTGAIHLLEQVDRGTASSPIPKFRGRVIDERHGTIHVPVADIDGDGRPDFVALISQEFEEVVAFLNRGEGKFERRLIFRAPEPAFGMSGIELVDLDGDADIDVLLTSGDTMDSYYLLPTHGVRWLENGGDFPFTEHLIARLPGAYRALPVDLDGDGQLDIVACASMPTRLHNPGKEFATLLWLRRDGDRFLPHVLERGGRGYVSLEVGDFDGDGLPEIATGNFGDESASRWLDIWRRQAR